ncbi:MAG: sigma-70 family RNA polymerase sigma factor [Phycisphaeraceae bacterium]|nr:sigma-70 family RNA polymerase sigma factor [Phycisphaeraceae bacterium]
MGQPGATDTINTPEFFARLVRCDSEAVGILFREYAGAMMDFLLKTKRRHGLAEDGWGDAVQEVFVKFLSKPPDLDPSRKIGPLLMTMALNEARDRAKKERTRLKCEEAAKAERLRTAAGAEAVGARLAAAEDKTLVEGKLAQMSQPDRQALATFVQSGPNRHVAALAATTGTKPGAAQMRFQRAKDRWANVLGEGKEGKDNR